MAIRIASVAEFLTVETPPFLRQVSGSTIVGWFRLLTGSNNSGGTLMRVDDGPGTGARIELGLLNDLSLGLGARADDADPDVSKTAVSTGLLSVGPWVHLAAVADYANDLAFIYLNGANVALTGGQTAAFVGTQTSNTDSARMSIFRPADGGEDFEVVEYEDVRVYGRALGPFEILTLYTAKGCDGIVSGLQARYYFNSQPLNTNLNDVVGGEPNIASGRNPMQQPGPGTQVPYVAGVCRGLRQKQAARARLIT